MLGQQQEKQIKVYLCNFFYLIYVIFQDWILLIIVVPPPPHQRFMHWKKLPLYSDESVRYDRTGPLVSCIISSLQYSGRVEGNAGEVSCFVLPSTGHTWRGCTLWPGPAHCGTVGPALFVCLFVLFPKMEMQKRKYRKQKRQSVRSLLA